MCGEAQAGSKSKSQKGSLAVENKGSPPLAIAGAKPNSSQKPRGTQGLPCKTRGFPPALRNSKTKTQHPCMGYKSKSQKGSLAVGSKRFPPKGQARGNNAHFASNSNRLRASFRVLAVRQVTIWQKPIPNGALFGLPFQTETIPNHTLVRSMASCKLP